MKIRTGFVSNSSSSAFLILFDKKDIDILIEDIDHEPSDETRAHMRKMMFGSVKSCDKYLEESVVSIMLDAIRHHMNDPDRQVDLMDVFQDYVNDESAKSLGWCCDDDLYQNLCLQDSLIAHRKMFEFTSKHPDSMLLAVEFSDDCGGVEAEMEQGDYLDGLTVIARISHH